MKTTLITVTALITGFAFGSCTKPSEPEMNNPYDEEIEAFIELPGLSTMEVTDIDVPAAISGGRFTNDFGYEIIAKGVCWSKKENPSLDDECTDEGSGKEDFTSLLKPIEYNGNYFVRAYAANKAGIVYANQQQFKTKNTYELTVNIIGQGSIEENVIEEPAKTEYPEETVVELTAVPADGWVFDHWQEDLSGNENPEQVTINEAKVVTAVFKRKDFELTVTITGEGTVKETVIDDPAKTAYPSETVVELTANPDSGWKFDRWEGALQGSKNPEKISMNQNHSILAVFGRIQTNFYDEFIDNRNNWSEYQNDNGYTRIENGFLEKSLQLDGYYHRSTNSVDNFTFGNDFSIEMSVYIEEILGNNNSWSFFGFDWNLLFESNGSTHRQMLIDNDGDLNINDRIDGTWNSNSQFFSNVFSGFKKGDTILLEVKKDENRYEIYVNGTRIKKISLKTEPADTNLFAIIVSNLTIKVDYLRIEGSSSGKNKIFIPKQDLKDFQINEALSTPKPSNNPKD